MRRFWILLGVTFAVRVLYLALVPLDLEGDEAYYWEWGRRLALGYYSKPPLIGWLMALADWLGGGTAFGLRIWATLFGTGTLLFTFLLGRRIYDARVGFWAALVTLCMPATVALNMLLTIDAPLLFFWTTSLYLFWRLAHDPDPRGRAWLALALCLTLGLGHLAKQMMMVFPLLALATLDRQGLGRLRVLLPPMLLSYLSLIPPLYWNYRHDWITFTHTSHHFARAGIEAFPKNLGRFLGEELGVLSPLLFMLIFGLGISSVFVLRRLQVRERFLVLLGGLPLLVVLLMTVRQSVLANWPAVFFGASIVLLAAWALGATRSRLPLSDRMRSWLKPALWVGGVMTLVFLVLPFTNLEIKRTAFVRLLGWSELAAQVDAVRQTLPDPSTPLLVTGHRHNTSQLAFYLHDQPRVYRFPGFSGVIESQYEEWDELGEIEGREVLLVMETSRPGEAPDPQLAGLFDKLRPVGEVNVPVTRKRSRSFALYLGRFGGLPEVPST